jgi:hypothetical protein
MSFTASDGTVFQDRREFRRYEFELSYTFRNRGGLTDARLELRKDAPSISGQPFELEKLHSCDVLLLDHTEAIQADELENCRFVIRFAVALLVGCNHISLTFWISLVLLSHRVLIGACCDSVFVRNCTGCTFTIACKQLRTRDCVGCTFYLLCNTEPVIETSTDIAVAPLNACYPGLLEHVAAAGLDPKLNLWFAVVSQLKRGGLKVDLCVIQYSRFGSSLTSIPTFSLSYLVSFCLCNYKPPLPARLQRSRFLAYYGG